MQWLRQVVLSLSPFFVFLSPFESILRESHGLVELMGLMWQIRVVVVLLMVDRGGAVMVD